jgi:hypothetical protein
MPSELVVHAGRLGAEEASGAETFIALTTRGTEQNHNTLCVAGRSSTILSRQEISLRSPK